MHTHSGHDMTWSSHIKGNEQHVQHPEPILDWPEPVPSDCKHHSLLCNSWKLEAKDVSQTSMVLSVHIEI